MGRLDNEGGAASPDIKCQDHSIATPRSLLYALHFPIASDPENLETVQAELLAASVNVLFECVQYVLIALITC